MKLHLINIIIGVLLLGTIETQAQEIKVVNFESNASGKEVNKPFSKLYGALTLGTTGIGIDLAMPINDMFQIRAGYSFMPSFKHKMHFDVVSEQRENNESGKEIATLTSTKFEQMADIVYQATGIKMDRNVEMIGEPTYNNAKLLVDVFPFENKKWHFTAGFYFGGSRIARAYNSAKDVATMTGINMYNHILDKVEAAYADPYNPFNDVVLFNYKGANVILPQNMADKIHEYGQKYGHMGFQLGDYWLTPDEDNMVKANAHTNRFKPYIGFGYGNATPKAGKRYGYMLECGMMFWGGSPSVDCYGTDLTKMHVKGDAGNYIKLIKGFVVFPVINLRITRRLF